MKTSDVKFSKRKALAKGKNCLNCASFSKCSKSKKSGSYVCESYKKIKVKGENAFSLEDMFADTNFHVADDYSDFVPIEDEHDFKNMEINVVKMMDEIFESENPYPRDLKIDDRDLPEFKNIYEYFFDPVYGLAKNMQPFSRQLWAGVKLFGDYCPICSDHKFMEDIENCPISMRAIDFPEHVVFMENGKCPKCKGHKLDFVKKGYMNFYRDFAACLGQRSGKSVTFSMFSGYHHHKFLKMGKPAELLTGLPNVTLTATYTATDFKTAMETLWQPFVDIIDESPWFKAYHSMLDHYGKKYGEEIYRFKESFLHYKHTKMFTSAASPNKRTMRGRCLTGDTLVNTSQGTMHFSEFIKEMDYNKTDLQIMSHLGGRTVSHTYKSEETETYKLRTRNGFSVEGTPEHPMLVLNEDLSMDWVTLDKLKVGQWIVSKTNKEKTLYGNAKLSKTDAELLGYFVANGYRNEVSTNDQDVANRLIYLGKKITGVIPTHTKNNSSIRADSYRFIYKNGESNFVRDYLNPLGYDFKNSKDKMIPAIVRMAPREVMHEFLEAYFKCDSGINGGSKNSPSEIEVGSASKKLAKQLHVILFKNYGILGRLTKHTFYDKLNKTTGNFNAKRNHWTITITGYDANLFLQTFKKAKVQKYKDRIKDVPKGFMSDRRSVPYVRKFLWDLYENSRLVDTLGKRLRRLIAENGSVVLNNIKPKCFDRLRSSRDIYEETPEYLIYGDDWDILIPRIKDLNLSKGTALKDFLSFEGHFEQVVEIKKSSKKKTVYDVTVPDGHAFIANCLVSHNTRFEYAIDELGWFDASSESKDKVRISADEIYGALDRSMKTVMSASKRLFLQGYSGTTPGMSFNISSPSAYDDKIMSMCRIHKDSRVVLALHLPTWKYNPKEPKENFRKEYMEDPIKAERDFGANPPMAASPFFENINAIVPNFTDKANFATYEYSLKKVNNTLYKSAKLKLSVRGDIYPSVLALDAGFSNNSFALAVGHRREKETIFTTLIEIMPDKGKNVLNYNSIFEEVVVPLVDSLNVQFICADRWNSLFLLHKLEEDKKIKQMQYSVKYADFNLFKSYSEGNRILFPKMEMRAEKALTIPSTEYIEKFTYKPCAHLFSQIFTVEDKGRTVDKGKNRTDDLFRAVVLASRFLLDDSWVAENLNLTKRKNSNMGIVALANGASPTGTLATATGKGIISSGGH